MKDEFKVGALFLVAISLVIIFLFLIGAVNIFSSERDIRLLYNYAGGIEKGSPVRLMGIKVGKVKDVAFKPHMKDKKGEEVKLTIIISVNKDAWKIVREDSRFFINLSGVIGEKYIEITPGSLSSAPLDENSFYRGEDPPRIDMLISQSFNLAGKILEIVKKNEGKIFHMFDTADKLITNVNKTLMLLEKVAKPEQIVTLVKNLAQISGDIAAVSGKLRSKDTKKTIDLIHKLIWRLEKMDEKAIRKFLQKDGIKARLF